MIVLSQAFVLAPGDVPLNTPVFLWDNQITTGNIVATSEDTAYPATNLANPSTALKWQAAEEGSPLAPPASDIYLTVTLNSPEEIDALAIAGHNLATGQNVVSVEIDTGGSPSWTEIVEEAMLARDDATIFRFAPTSVLGIRLRIQAGSELPYIAAMSVGKLLVMERGTHTDHVPITLGRTANVTSDRSEAGHYLGRIVLSEKRATTIDFQRVRASWYRTHMDPFIEASKESPFWFAWKPQEYPNDVGYCSMTNDPQPVVHFGTGTHSISLQITGAAV